MAMAALRLRRRHLLADPTRFLLTRIEPQIHLIRSAAAAASLPSQRAADPFRLGSYIHPHRLPSPRSTPSAASIDSHRTPSPRPIHSVPSVSLHHFSPPRSTLSAFSIGDHCPSAEDQCHMGLLAAVGAGPRALPRGRRASSHLMGNQAARRILSAADPRLPQVSPSRSLGLGPKRFFSSVPATSPEVQRRRLPPVSQLVFRDDSQVSEEEWVDPIEYLKEHSLLVDARTNHLNLEIPGFGDHPRYNFSEDTGVPLFQSLVFLALINNNRGYCVKNSFTMDNVLLCPRLKQFRFKVVDQDDVHLNSVNRASSYIGAAQLMRQLLHDTVGADAIACLLEEPRDLFSKLERPSDERLIMYHPSFLSTNGRIWFYQKLYMFFFKVIPCSDDVVLTKLAKTALDNMAYTSPSAQSIEDIIKEHPLLAHIDSKKPTSDPENEENLKNSGRTVGKYVESRRLGKMVVALPRHVIEHAFDKESRQVQSKLSTEAKLKQLWQYSHDQVVDLLRSIIPVYLLKAQEIFLRMELWDHLQVDNFWARDLTWMGGVPKPTADEENAIKPSYGKRRQQAKKFDWYNRGTSAATKVLLIKK